MSAFPAELLCPLELRIAVRTSQLQTVSALDAEILVALILPICTGCFDVQNKKNKVEITIDKDEVKERGQEVIDKSLEVVDTILEKGKAKAVELLSNNHANPTEKQ